jgi:hypothetical protein
VAGVADADRGADQRHVEDQHQARFSVHVGLLFST